MKIRNLIGAGLFWASLPALAWGPEGHAMVADMAEVHLSLPARVMVEQLLSVEGYRHLDQISSWPDAIRSQQPDTGPWHYVDIPLYAEQYNEARDCHQDQHNQHVDELTCVVTHLPDMVQVLADPARSLAEREVALKWVVHLLGDIHQPLHTEDDHDRGGNDVRLDWDGERSNLHAVWDLGVIERRYDWHLGPGYSFNHDAARQQALLLDRDVTVQQRLAWAPAGELSHIRDRTVDWTNASHHLACAAYRHLPPVFVDGWENAYQAWAWPVIRDQLDKAGVRLAELLNEVAASQAIAGH